MKEPSPPKQDRGTVASVTNLTALVKMDGAGPGEFRPFILSEWRGTEMPKTGDRVFCVRGYDVQAGRPRDKWKILPPELDTP